MNKPHVRVGVGVFVRKNGKFLLLKRYGSHGAESWCLPGGHLEFGESFTQTAQREVKEETGLSVTNLRFAGVTNDIFADEDKHYITIWMLSNWQSGTERIMEPEKCREIGWHNFENMPSPLFLPWKQLFESDFINDIKKQFS